MSYAAQQPKEGDIILVCEHVEEKNQHCHWYKLPMEAVVNTPHPGKQHWMSVCDGCHKVMQTLNQFPNGVKMFEHTWKGDEPFIKTVGSC